jgi:peptidoglycan/LPS O-acetylase OafA/YrhL
VFAAFSLSNLMLWSSKAGYFDAATEQLPLLHTWSLSVEEQFYLLVPLLFWGTSWLAHRLSWAWQTTFGRLACGLAALSLLTVAWQSGAAPMSAYYLISARGFEFLLGGLAALGWPGGALAAWHKSLKGRAWQPALAAAAALALGVALLLSSRGHVAVGWMVLTAVATTALLCALAGSRPMRVRSLLVWGPMVWVGQRSYGWYLWHFPALVLWRAYWLEDTTPAGDLVVCLAALLLAHVTYVAVEQPGRHAPTLTAWGLPRLLAAAAGLLVALAGLSGGLAVWAKHVARPSPSMQLLEAQIADRGATTAPCLDFGDGALGVLPSACQHGPADAPASVVDGVNQHGR